MRAPKPKEGRRFRQPPGVASHSLAHPGDGRAAVAASMVHYRQGTWNPAFQRSRCVRWPVTGTGTVPKSRDPASMSLRSLPALRRSGIAIRSSIDTIPKVVSFDHLASVPFARRLSVPSRRWLPLSGLARRRRRSAATRSTRSEDGLCVHGVQSGPLPESIGPCPSACHPRRKAGRCHWTPVRSVGARTMRTSPLRFPGVASPSRSMRFPEGTCTGPGRDKHLISLWFPAAASSACPMMLSRFASRAKG